MRQLPRMNDDVMLNGVFRICLWLVARQLRYQTDKKRLWPKRIALRLRSFRNLRRQNYKLAFARGRENYQSNAAGPRCLIGSRDCSFVADNETGLFLHRTGIHLDIHLHFLWLLVNFLSAGNSFKNSPSSLFVVRRFLSMRSYYLCCRTCLVRPKWLRNGWVY